MSDDKNNLASIAEEVSVMLANGDLESAVRRSGEALALADNEARKCYEQNGSAGSAVADMIELAILHVHTLRMAKASVEAFSCAVTALLTVEVYKASCEVDAARKTRLYFDAVRSAIDSFESIVDPNDAQCEEHRGYILSFLASLLYHYYGKAVESEPEASFLPEIYDFLRAISGSGAIQSPVISLGHVEVDPEQPGALLIDIMTRAAALGIYS